MDNPLSIVPSEGDRNDFPVLKAFQEYIDAEQAKARKRMLGLSVFFIVLLFVVVVTFVMILTTVLNRNQSLSDRLLDYALEGRQNTPVVQQVPAPIAPQPSADIVKALVERLEREQAEMKASFEKRQKEAERKALDLNRMHEEELERIQSELLKEREKNKKAAEKKAAIEQHRRRLYPDYYRMESVEDPPLPPPASAFRHTTAQPAKPSSKKVSVDVKQPPSPALQSKSTESPLSALKPVSYFNVGDDDSVPFLIETPKQNK